MLFLSIDETKGLRKRRGEVSEEKPGDQAPSRPEDMSDQSEPVDTTATALNNLALEKKPEEQQQAVGSDIGAGQKPTVGDSSGDTIRSDHSSGEASGECQCEGTRTD